MNNILTGNSEAFTVLGQIQATDDDLALVGQYVGSEVKADDIAIVEAIAFDDTRNKAGWQVADLDKITTIGASLNYDHSTKQAESFGTVFAERREGNRKIVKAVIPKTVKNENVLTDLKYKVANYTSPSIQVDAWADEKKKVVGSGRMLHLSFVQSPAFGVNNKVLSLAASDEISMRTDDYETLGKQVHAENVTAAVRYAERRNGGFTDKQRDEARAKYEAMPPLTLNADVLPMLKDIVSGQVNQNTSQKTVSGLTADSTIKTINPNGLNLRIGDK